MTMMTTWHVPMPLRIFFLQFVSHGVSVLDLILLVQTKHLIYSLYNGFDLVASEDRPELSRWNIK